VDRQEVKKKKGGGKCEKEVGGVFLAKKKSKVASPSSHIQTRLGERGKGDHKRGGVLKRCRGSARMSELETQSESGKIAK